MPPSSGWADVIGMQQEIDSLNAKLRLRPTREEMQTEIQRAIQEHTRVERRASDPQAARLEASMIELRESVVGETFLREQDD